MKPFPIRRAAALCLACLGLCAGCSPSDAPDPAPVQVVNPIMTVASPAEMEEKLDFAVPILDRAIENCTVLVIDGYPTVGRLTYADGAQFSIKYGSGDISGIYGGVKESETQIGGVPVTIYTYDTLRYALWERDGFTHSLTGGETLEADVAALLG